LDGALSFFKYPLESAEFKDSGTPHAVRNAIENYLLPQVILPCCAGKNCAKSMIFDRFLSLIFEAVEILLIDGFRSARKPRTIVTVLEIGHET